MNKHGKTYFGWTACFCYQNLGATAEEDFGEDSNHWIELTDLPQLDNPM